MFSSIYNALVQFVGNPSLLNLPNAPEIVKIGNLAVYVVSCMIVFSVVMFPFKFLLKLVER